jgi:hypothetical protein
MFKNVKIQKRVPIFKENSPIKKDMASTERSEGRRFLLLLFFAAGQRKVGRTNV